MELVTIENLTFSYPGAGENVLRDITTAVAPGEFVVVIGPSGCGKSTLLRQLKTCLAPHGERSGRICFEGKPLDEVPTERQASAIGFVRQDPDQQLITDKVWHELAFGLESLGFDSAAIRGRVAEMSSFFGIQSWFYRDVNSLSGGQKQLLNLASVMVMEPELLILDEPTSQLDPIAAGDFLATLGRVHRELGTSIILTEHRLEEVMPLADRVIVMDAGRILFEGTPAQVFEDLKRSGSSMLGAMPAPMRIWSAVESNLPCPLTVSQGRDFLTRWGENGSFSDIPAEKIPDFSGIEPAITATDVWFRYEKDSPDVVKGFEFSARPGELTCILGGNGTGKTTALRLLSGARKPYRGKVETAVTRVAALPQNPQTLFLHDTVREEITGERAEDLIRLCGLERLLNRHPYDLSGGEQQRAALAKVLLSDPELLLLDEPTKGFDAEFKAEFARILRDLTDRGVCIVMVSHDVEFCAAHADRCVLFFDGAVVTQAPPRAFFSTKRFYTTAASRMARHVLPEAVTPEDVIAACGGTVPKQPERKPPQPLIPPEVGEKIPALPLWRKILAWIAGIAALASIAAASCLDLTELVRDGRPTDAVIWIYGAAFLSLIVLALAVNRKEQRQQVQFLRGRLSARTKAGAVFCLALIPLTIWIGLVFFGQRQYLAISLLVLLETMIPFFLIFEGRHPQARELVVLAVLCALGVGGRMAFFALPSFKPVAAVVIVAGVAFGGESGFLVGAVSMFASNLFFGQGPWTPWQMFSMGLIGMTAGTTFRFGLLRRGKTALSIFGFLAVMILYGGIMNPATMLMAQTEPSWEKLLTYYLTGVPVDLVHASATAVFLWLLGMPLLKKLDRIKVKYGLMEP